MKTISVLIIGFFTAISVLAQTVSTVTINVRGNNTESVMIDGTSYTVTSDYNANTNTPIVVSNLQAGQHTLQIQKSNDVNPTSTVFTTRTGYDLQITITANGSVQLRETKWRSDNGTNPSEMTPMSSTDFNTLYNNVRRQWRSANRTTMVSDAFANNYFTTTQARQLILLVNSQSTRFTLAKAAYPRVIDPVNFTQLYEVFNSQSYRDQLADYVNTYNASSSSTAMNTGRFNSLYRSAQRQATANSKLSYINNAFTNTNNYFTVAQARQLIQLVSGDENRLYLAKVSYRSIVDKNNFYLVNSLLNSQSSRNELTTFVNSYDGSNPVYTKVAMKEADYNVLYRDVQNRFGIGAKMSALENIFANSSYYFTTIQAEELIKLVSSESNRLALAKSAYDNVIDQNNFDQLYDVLSSTASRNELDNYVRNSTGSATSPVPASRTPMSTTSYNTIYNNVRNTWGFGAKMSELTDIFNNETYYFTVAQAKQLIGLVSSESNRLQLAKSAYNNITDPDNFSNLYDLLSSQSSKNELSAYVNSYSYN